MQIDLMVCDHAQVTGGKLFVSGAGINRMLVPPGATVPYVVNFSVAGVVTLSPADAAIDHVVAFRLMTADGRTPTIAGPDRTAPVVSGELVTVAGDQVATEDQLVSVAFAFNGVPLANLGEHVVIVSVDGVETRRISFVVEAQA